MVRLYRITETASPLNVPVRYNVAPTQDVPAVRPAKAGGRELAMLRWGLIPAWAKDEDIGARLINARGETAAELPSFRAAFRRRRCLVAADGFYEWRKAGKGPKQPFLVELADGRPFAFAGLWERWDKAPDGRPLETCTIITTRANELLAPIHDRMPVILPPADYDAWLDVEGTGVEAAKALLRPYPAAAMAAHPVSPRVNNARNDDAACLARLPG
jgi:putative SOS response-associated peptidase YedK